MTPNNVRVDVQTSSFSSITDASAQQQEPWFSMPYVTNPIDEALLTQWGSTPPSAELQLPPQNDFIPTDFSLRSDDTATASTSQSTAASNGQSASKRNTRSQGQQQQQQQQQQHSTVAQVGQKHAHNGSAVSNGHNKDAPEANSWPTAPEMVCDEPGLRLWHKLDRQFETPKAAAYFCVTSAAMYESPAAAAATHLLMKLLEDALCETAYLADVAGLSYDVSLPSTVLLCIAALMRAGISANNNPICCTLADFLWCTDLYSSSCEHSIGRAAVSKGASELQSLRFVPT